MVSRGGAGRRRVLLARRAAIHAGSQTVWQAAGRHPTGAAQAGEHDDRDHAGVAGRVAGGPPDGRGQGRAGNGLTRQAQFVRQSAGDCPRLARYARRQRHQR